MMIGHCVCMCVCLCVCEQVLMRKLNASSIASSFCNRYFRNFSFTSVRYSSRCWRQQQQLGYGLCRMQRERNVFPDCVTEPNDGQNGNSFSTANAFCVSASSVDCVKWRVLYASKPKNAYNLISKRLQLTIFNFPLGSACMSHNGTVSKTSSSVLFASVKIFSSFAVSFNGHIHCALHIEFGPWHCLHSNDTSWELFTALQMTCNDFEEVGTTRWYVLSGVCCREADGVIPSWPGWLLAPVRVKIIETECDFVSTENIKIHQSNESPLIFKGRISENPLANLL